MKTGLPLAIFSALALLCFLAMLAVTLIWMHVPTRIIYYESSQVRTEAYSVEVREHGHSFFITARQKRTLDLIRFYTPIIWFSCFAYLFLFTALGGFERLRLLRRPGSAASDSS